MRKRTQRVVVCLTRYELETLDKKVRKTKLSREGYIRKVLDEAPLYEAPQAEYYDLLRELRLCGTQLRELNDQARLWDSIHSEKLEAALAQNRATERMLWDAFLRKP